MSDIATIIKAANFSAIKHKDQRRKDPEGTPYINHPLGVANILTNVSKTRVCNRYVKLWSKFGLEVLSGGWWSVGS